MAKQLPGTDELTNKNLEQAKKGKSFKFAFIYKGANVLKLAVFKKGAYQTQINAAKKEGHKGKGCWAPPRDTRRAEEKPIPLSDGSHWRSK